MGQPRRKLGRSMQRAVAQVILQLASKAQYSKACASTSPSHPPLSCTCAQLLTASAAAVMQPCLCGCGGLDTSRAFTMQDGGFHHCPCLFQHATGCGVLLRCLPCLCRTVAW